MNYKKIVCIYPYTKVLPYFGFFPPIGIEYIAAALRELVDDVTVVDMRFEKDLRSAVAGADMFCVSVGWFYDIDEVAETIRSLPRGATVVVGGKYATENVKEMFERCPNIGVIVRGDGEETVQELVRTGSPDQVRGLSFRGADGEIRHNPNRSLPPVSDTLFPDRSRRRYRYEISYRKTSTGLGFDAVMSSRGCPYNCKFCSFNFDPMGQKRVWSARSPESVVAELKGTDAGVIMFIDENFFADVKRAEAICDLIIREKIDRIFVGQARVSIGFHPELVRKMHAAGFRLILMGLESAHDKTLKQLQKGFTTAEVRKAFEVLRRSNMVIHGYFIVGNIGETKEEMYRIASFAKEIGVDTIALSKLRFEKYSALEELLANNKDYFVDVRGDIVSRQYSSSDIKRFRREIKREFFDAKQFAALIVKAVRIRFPPWSFVWRFAWAYIREEIGSRRR
ncbi:MAG TPA: radical SAM protein [bacterium]|nr:radical SAM protein [bacterium]